MFGVSAFISLKRCLERCHAKISAFTLKIGQFWILFRSIVISMNKDPTNQGKEREKEEGESNVEAKKAFQEKLFKIYGRS